MFDAIAVLNAGSSSLKFSLFAERGNALELTVRGQTVSLEEVRKFVPTLFSPVSFLAMVSEGLTCRM